MKSPLADQQQLAAKRPSCIHSIRVKSAASFFLRKSFVFFHPLVAKLVRLALLGFKISCFRDCHRSGLVQCFESRAKVFSYMNGSAI
jgi:hypothetical protein